MCPILSSLPCFAFVLLCYGKDHLCNCSLVVLAGKKINIGISFVKTLKNLEISSCFCTVLVLTKMYLPATRLALLLLDYQLIIFSYSLS